MRSGDNVFDLAKKFVESFNLHSSEIQHLAYLIRTQINRYVERMEQPSSTTSASSKNSVDNQPILKMIVELGYGKSGTIVVRRGDDVRKLARNFASTFGLKKWKENEIAAELRRQLALSASEAANESSSTSVPPLSSSSISPSLSTVSVNSFTPQQQQQQQQQNAHAELVSLKSVPSTPRGTSSIDTRSDRTVTTPRVASPPIEEDGELLFNMEIEICEGVKKSLAVHRYSDSTKLAHVFAQQNKLKEKAEAKLVKLINYHIQRFYEKHNV